MKLRMCYKREGDRLFNTMCDEEGYTFSFFFQHGDARQTQ